jgi:hypothetical protein
MIIEGMVSNTKFYIRVAVGALIFACATFFMASKLFASRNAETKALLRQSAKVSEPKEVHVKHVSWNWLFTELRLATSAQHEVWKKEDDVKRMSGAGSVAIGIEQLRELKQELTEKQESYEAKLKEAQCSDPEGFKHYTENSKQWREAVNEAHLNYRFARTIEEMRSTHTAYLEILYNTEIELP